VKKLYNILGYQLTILFIIYIILYLFIGIYWIFISDCHEYLGAPGLPYSPPWYQKFALPLVQFMLIFTAIVFLISLISFIIGCTRYLSQKQKTKLASGKTLMLRGLFGIAIILILFLIVGSISYLSSITGIC
jgi:hypothetical protein